MQKTPHLERFSSFGWLFGLIESESCCYSEYKGIKHYNKAHKTEPGEYFKIILNYGMPNILKGLHINFFQK